VSHPCPRPTAAPWIAAAALLLAVACGPREAPPPRPAAAPAAPAPSPAEPEAGGHVDVTPQAGGTVVARTLTPDGKVFEAEYGGANQLPRDFPKDVPLYGNAKPMSSMSSPTDGTVVNLRTTDPPAQVFDWYKQHFSDEGWRVEHEQVDRSRRLLAVRKGNRIASVVVVGVPEFTQALVTVAEDR
jgi:hypothetical protein